jgi:hypothetical protein
MIGEEDDIDPGADLDAAVDYSGAPPTVVPPQRALNLDPRPAAAAYEKTQKGGYYGALAGSNERVATTKADAKVEVARIKAGAKAPAAKDEPPLELYDEPIFAREVKPVSKQGTLWDLADQFMASTAETGQSLVSFASAATRKLTENPAIVGWLEEQQKWLGNQAESWISNMSPEGQAAAHASLFGGSTTDADGKHIPSPGEVGYARYAAHTVIGFIPAPIVMIGGGALTAAAVSAALPAGAAGAAAVAGTATMAGLGGAMQAGGFWHSYIDTLDKATHEQMMGSPVYAEAFQSGVPPVDAKRVVADAAMPFLYAQGILGTVAGGATGRLIKSGVMGGASSGLRRRAAIGSAEGSALMGAQSGGGDVLSQAANIQSGVQPEFNPAQAIEAGASGAIGGALLGAGAGALHRARPVPEKPGPVTVEGIAPDQQLALNEALQITGPPRGQLQITFNPNRTMGDGFTMPPEGTPAVPTQPQLPAPAERLALTYNPERAAQRPLEGTQGEGFVISTPEPARDIAAQVQGMLDPAAPRDAVFVAKGSPMPAVPPGVMVVPRGAGTLLTTNQEKATAFRRGPIDDAKMAAIQMLASPRGVPAAVENVQANVPGGGVRVGTPEAMQERRLAEASPSVEAAARPIEPTPTQAEAVSYKNQNRGEQLRAQQKARMATPPARTYAGTRISPEELADAVKEKTGWKRDPEGGWISPTSVALGEAHRRTANQLVRDGWNYDDRRGWISPDGKAGVRSLEMIPGPKPAIEHEPVAALVKRNQVRPARPETKAEEDVRPMSEGAREESEGQAQVFEGESRAPTTVVEETSQERARSAQTTNKDRLLSDLESKVANKLMTAAEADKEYGRKTPGTGGRDRKYPNFSSWLKERIEQAEDPKVQDAIVARRTRLQNDKTLTGPKRTAEMREVNRELDRTGPEYAEKLREMLREVEDPIAVAAERRERMASARAGVRGLEGKLKKGNIAGADRGAVAALFRDERINRPIWDLLDTPTPLPGVKGQVSRSRSVHEYLDRIANDPVIRVRLPQAVARARRLKQLLPRDLEVYSKDYAEQIFRTEEGRYPEQLAGAFDPFHDIIILNPRARADSSAVEVMLHEATHAVTTRYLRENPARAGAVLAAIREELSENHPSGISGAEAKTLEYALSNNEELHTMLMTSPIMQRIAAEITPTPEFRAAMRELGYGPQESRSLWRAFTGWVRRIFGKPDISDSLLDHILRPLEDIVDRADKFNRGQLRILDDLPVELRGAARELGEAAISAMPRFGKDDLRETGYGMLGLLHELTDRGRKFVLGWATSDGIVKFNKDLYDPRQLKDAEGKLRVDREGKPVMSSEGNSLERLRAANEAEAAAAKGFRDEFGDRSQKLVERLKGQDGNVVAVLANDATLAKAHLGKVAADANSHLSKPEQQAILRQLQKRYDALSEYGKGTYNGLKDWYRETHAIERRESLAAMIKSALPEATSKQVEVLTEAARTMRGIKQLIDNPDASPTAAAFAGAWNSNRELVRGIANAHKTGFVQGDFFPLRRFGDYVINYDTKGTSDYGVEMFQRYSQAEARRAELKKQGAEPSHIFDKRKSHMRDMVPTTVMKELDDAIRRKPEFSDAQASSVRDLFASIQMQHAARSDMARTRMHRQGIKGASTDAAKVLAQDFMSLSSRIGFLKHGSDRIQAVAEMRRHTRWLEQNGEANEGIRASAVAGEMEQRQPAGDDASGAMIGLSQKMTSFGFVYTLMSPAHAIINAADIHMVSSALLGGRHGFARGGLALAKALKDVSPRMLATGGRNTLKAIGGELKTADWNLSYVARDRLIAAGANKANMIDLFDYANSTGIIDHSMGREMLRIANSGSNITKGWWGRTMDMTAMMSHAVDASNKSAILKAAYDLELRKNGSHDIAKKYAVETVRQSTPNYNMPNKNRWSTPRGSLGAFAGPLMQFKQFGFHMYSVMANLMRSSIHGATRDDRIEARKAFAGILATHSLMAGSLTLIADPLRYIGGAYDFVFSDKPHDYQNDARAYVAAAFGPTLGEIFSRGLPHLVGWDAHTRLGLGNMLNLPDLKSFDKKGYAEFVASAMTGVAGQDAMKMAEGLHKIIQGDLMSGIKDLVPRIIRDPIKAGIVPGAEGLADKGVMDAKGRTIFPASKFTTKDIAARALGFTPSRESEFQEQRRADIEFRDEIQSARSEVLNDFLTATPAGRRDAIAAIQKYNRANPLAQITYSQMVAGLKREQEKTRSRSGLILSKNMQAALNQRGSFANLQ